jgi:arsenite methyltransferase
MTENGSGQRADYGIDAPGVVRNNLVLGGVLTLAGIALLYHPLALFDGWGATLAVVLVFIGLSLLLTGGIMVWGSKSGKLRLRDRLLGRIPGRGDECVQDVGCGRGLMLIGAARRAPHGRVFGLDLWRAEDQSANSAAQTLHNAQAAAVDARIALTTADMRAMPFPDGCFDVITSSWAIHNIPEREGRTQAIREIVRVLHPGGWIAIADIERIDEYIETLELAGLGPVTRSRPYYIFAIPTHTLLAQKSKEEGGRRKDEG